MARAAIHDGSQPSSGRSVATGAVLGAAAYVLGYLATFAMVSVESDVNVLDRVDGGAELVGLVFYSAQFVPTRTSVSAAGQSVSETTNVLAAAPDLTIPRLVWTAVIVVVLVAAGYAAATRSGGSLAAGATVTLGYLPLAAAGTVLFSVNRGALGASFSAAPETVPAVLVAGIAFPAVCGGVGGLLNAG